MIRHSLPLNPSKTARFSTLLQTRGRESRFRLFHAFEAGNLLKAVRLAVVRVDGGAQMGQIRIRVQGTRAGDPQVGSGGETEAERAVAEDKQGFGVEDGGEDGVGVDHHVRQDVAEPARARCVSIAELVLKDPGAVRGDRGSG